MTKRFPDATADDRNEARPKGAGNADEPLKQSEPDKEVTHMPFHRHYTDSAHAGNPEQNETWQSIGDLARAMAEKSGGAK